MSNRFKDFTMEEFENFTTEEMEKLSTEEQKEFCRKGLNFVRREIEIDIGNIINEIINENKENTIKTLYTVQQFASFLIEQGSSNDN